MCINATGNNWNVDQMFSYCENLRFISGVFEGPTSTPNYMREACLAAVIIYRTFHTLLYLGVLVLTNNNTLFQNCQSLRKLPAEINTEVVVATCLIIVIVSFLFQHMTLLFHHHKIIHLCLIIVIH